MGFVSEDEYLEIQGITREQSGDYECSASNDVAAPVVRRVKVTVNYPPYISEAKGTGVPVGQTGTLQCEASAVPSAEFQWYKDDKRLVEGKKGVKVENRPFLSKLIFLNVSEHDYGNYTCVATNKLGHTNASITLFAIEANIPCREIRMVLKLQQQVHGEGLREGKGGRCTCGILGSSDLEQTPLSSNPEPNFWVLCVLGQLRKHRSDSISSSVT
ncbi:hypothetical protein J1605_022554 [Eschrichtius robustus]|uniref:Ig-like domain-containing protein n=1 Tax=Eschrichtius robustus TaxID=9764 RepID=A0AB34HBD7_ESCRO|nr:hypothetical protein J1605_022554 [Eschrichtius robustus]